VSIDTRGGLTEEQAATRLAEHGPNVVPGPRTPRLMTRVAQQLRDPLIAVLLIAAALTIGTGDYTDAIIIGVVVVVNTTVGVAQELRADRAIAALSALTAPAARVRRDNTSAVVAAVDLVPGDVILLGEGDIVPADAVVVEAARLTVDESALTGESVAVTKDAATPDRPADDLSAGTVVVRGRAEAVVTATGADSATGRIAALMTAPPTLTPLQRRLIGLGRVIAVVGAALCVVVLAIGLANGRSVEIMVVTAISLLVAAVPESLPAVVTLALALGARRMAATASATAPSAASAKVAPWTSCRTNTRPTATTAMIASRVESASSWRSRGVGPGSAAASSSATLPISVRMPVSVTTSSARPLVTVVLR
jgi:Ca2+-transporting ATPase